MVGGGMGNGIGHSAATGVDYAAGGDLAAMPLSWNGDFSGEPGPW
jgi:hypothetical protein